MLQTLSLDLLQDCHVYYREFENQSVAYADSEDIKIFIKLPGSSVSKIVVEFLKCVGDVNRSGRLRIKIFQLA